MKPKVRVLLQLVGAGLVTLTSFVVGLLPIVMVGWLIITYWPRPVSFGASMLYVAIVTAAAIVAEVIILLNGKVAGWCLDAILRS